MRKLSLKKESLSLLDTDQLTRVAAGNALVDTLDSTCPCNSVWAVNGLLDKVSHIVVSGGHTRGYCSH